ncbi:MAG: type II toxin-antitoxin system prevent-host-death family antitoxin [Spirochaetia bacterium]|jgi:prevent-host-death family protein|nr:type II toxin-antitoxin system prevent-host-death family antitoxin [Spirochaetia bacterium]
MDIGTFEAKTRFSAIIEEVQKGADYTITKRGKPVAKIIPFQEAGTSRAQAVAQLKKCRKLFKGNRKFNIRQAINRVV